MSEGATAETPRFRSFIKKNGDVHIPYQILHMTKLSAGDYATLEIVPSKPGQPESTSHEIQVKREKAEAEEVGENTFNYYLPLWMKNFRASLDLLGPNEKDINQLARPKRFKPTIVVGAGPSLAETNWATLRTFRGRVVASNKTLVPLLKNGVVPEWVCALDGLPDVMESFKDPIVKKYNGEINFLGATVLDPAVIKFALKWAKESYWGNPHIPSKGDSDRWNLNVVMELLNGRGMLSHGGNVGCMAWLLAKALKSNPIGMLGFDMCFHPDKTWKREDLVNYEFIYNPDNEEVMALDPPFKAYISILASVTDQAWNEEPPTATVNLTPRGALFSSGFFPNCTLADFIKGKGVIERASKERAASLQRVIAQIQATREAMQPIFRAEY